MYRNKDRTPMINSDDELLETFGINSFNKYNKEKMFKHKRTKSVYILPNILDILIKQEIVE